MAATIDEIAAEPEAVAGAVEVQLFEQASERVVAALHVADGVGGHQCRVRGTDSVKRGIGASKAVPSSATIW